jgi:diguanylate cyclase (GGDEF)-like protein
MRLVSVALVDVDQFAEVNRRFGSRVGDRILGTLGRLVEQLVAKESGLDRTFRFSGQQLLLFFGDTGPRSAMNSLEEVRQTLENSTFTYGTDEFTLNISAGVTEVEADEQTPRLYKRLISLVEVAKQGGRNCTSVDDGSGGMTVPPKDIQVPGRVVKIE